MHNFALLNLAADSEFLYSFIWFTYRRPSRPRNFFSARLYASEKKFSTSQPCACCLCDLLYEILISPTICLITSSFLVCRNIFNGSTIWVNKEQSRRISLRQPLKHLKKSFSALITRRQILSSLSPSPLLHSEQETFQFNKFFSSSYYDTLT